MTFIQIQKILSKMPKNPVPKSGLKIEFLGDSILFDCMTTKPLNVEEAKQVASWIAEVIGGTITWNDEKKEQPKTSISTEDSCAITLPKGITIVNDTYQLGKDITGKHGSAESQKDPVNETAPKPRGMDSASESPTTPQLGRNASHKILWDTIKQAKSFKDLNTPEYIRALQFPLYDPAVFELKDEDKNRLRNVSEVSEHEKRMIAEDKLLAGLSNKELENKYNLNKPRIKEILDHEMALMPAPKNYKPFFVARKTITEVYGMDYYPDIHWEKNENSQIKRLTAKATADIYDQDKARRDSDLPRITIKIRTCLACGAKFESSGPRTCGCTLEKRREFIMEDQSGAPL